MVAPRVSLPLLDARIEARASATREAHPWWPCREGCDRCCRSLPHLPTISRPEWDRLKDALDRLAPEVHAAIVRRTKEEAMKAGEKVICPMLDRERGSCLVYEARPIACRTYGFYVERDGGLHCTDVAAAVAENDAEDAVVWGNGEAIADELRALETQPLGTWMQSAEVDDSLVASASGNAHE